MTLFQAERRADQPTDSLAELFLRRRAPSMSTAGVPVDPDSAMRLSTVWACVDLIGAMVSTLPVHEYRRDPDGAQVKLGDPPLFMIPDGELGLGEWLYQLMGSLLLRGNAYGLILKRDAAGYPTKIKVLNPNDVTPPQQRGRLGPTEFKLLGKPVTRYDPVSGHGELWHLPAYTPAGSIVGLSPIAYAATAIGTGLAAHQFGANWFRDGAVPSAILKQEKPVAKEAAKLVKQSWVDVLFGGKREPVVLADGWTYEQVSVNPNESQFLDAIRASAVDICGYFRTPPELVARAVPGASQTYSNIEMRHRQLLTFTLNPWLVKLEKALSGLRPRPRYIKFNRDAPLAVDSATRWKVYETGIRNGVLSPDEARELEEREPIPEQMGERWLWPPMRSQLSDAERLLGADSTMGEEGFASPELTEPQLEPVLDEFVPQEPEPASSNGNGQAGG